MSIFFFFSVFLLSLLSSQELALRRGVYCHGTDLMRYYGYAYALHGLGVAMTRAQT